MFTVLAALSGMEREYTRDRTLEGPRVRPQTWQGHRQGQLTDDAIPGLALHLRNQELSLRDITSWLVITKGKKKGRHSITGNRRAHAARARPASRRKASTGHGPINPHPHRRSR